MPDGTLAPSLFLAIVAKSRGYNILELDVTHKERDTGEVSLRRFRLLKFCAQRAGADARAHSPCPLIRNRHSRRRPDRPRRRVASSRARPHELVALRSGRARRRTRVVGDRSRTASPGISGATSCSRTIDTSMRSWTARSATRGSSTCAKRGSGCAIAGFRIRSRTTSGAFPRRSSTRASTGLRGDAAARAITRRRRRFANGCCDRSARASAIRFLFPYNRKVWAYDPSALDVQWMGERVATVNLPRILENIALKRDDVSWGPNSTFRFPLHGGTGAIWQSVQQLLPADAPAFRSRDHANRHAQASHRNEDRRIDRVRLADLDDAAGSSADDDRRPGSTSRRMRRDSCIRRATSSASASVAAVPDASRRSAGSISQNRRCRSIARRCSATTRRTMRPPAIGR